MATYLARPECRDNFWHVVTYDISDPARWVETKDRPTTRSCDEDPPTIEPAPDTVIVDPPPPLPSGTGGTAGPVVPACEQPACLAATTAFLLQQVTADDLATLSRDACRQWKSAAIAAAAALATAAAATTLAIKVCVLTAWWAPYICAAAWIAAGVAAAASALATGFSLGSLYTYRNRRTACRTAMVAKTTAYRNMVTVCQRECATKTAVSCAC